MFLILTIFSMEATRSGYQGRVRIQDHCKVDAEKKDCRENMTNLYRFYIMKVWCLIIVFFLLNAKRKKTKEYNDSVYQLKPSKQITESLRIVVALSYDLHTNTHIV